MLPSKSLVQIQLVCIRMCLEFSDTWLLNLVFVFLSMCQIRSLHMLRTHFSSLPSAFTKRLQPNQPHQEFMYYTSREKRPMITKSCVMISLKIH